MAFGSMGMRGWQIAMALAALSLASPRLSAQDLGSGQFQILGTALDISPETQAVPVAIPTIIHTALPVPAGTTLPAGLLVRGELTGPGIAQPAPLAVSPGSDFQIPGQSVRGEYNNRLDATDPNGTVVTYAYDDADHLTGKTMAKGGNVLGPGSISLTLDDVGRTIGATTDEGVSETFSYDSLDRQIREDVRVGSGGIFNVGRGYDPAGNVTGLTYPSGVALTQAIDPLNRVSSITDSSSQVAVAAYTDAGSRMTGKTFANGISETWSYDPNRRLSEILSRSSAAALRDVQYQRSPIGNKLAILRPDLSKQATYRFNPNSWITNESLGVPLSGGSAQVSTDYTPDKTLNYTSITRNGQTISITVNGRNQYATFGGESLGYDRNGNLLSLHGIGLAYDFENHLRKATLPDGSTVENLYDGQGRKLEEKITVSGTSTTRDYVLSGDQVVEEYQNGVLSARYVHGRDIDEIVRVEQNANANQDGTLDRTLYPIQDDLGNVERLTDANGLTAERYEYEGYGKPSIFDASGNVLSSSAYNWRWLFQGREYGSLLNAYDFRARHLWPELGRFGQEDPAGTRDSQNGYQGLLGEWNSRSDPTGELTVIVHGTRAQGSFDFMPGGRFFESVRKTMKDEEVVSFQWSGLDNHAGRRIGGERLAADIKAHSFKPGEPLNIIAHSHGGNVVIWAMNLGLGHPVTNFVTLGTPYRDGYRVRDLSYVLNWVNLFNIHDKVQINGGGEYRETGMETGPAGRHHPGATINISWGKNCGPMDSHSALHTPEAWDLVVSSLKNIPTKKPQRSRIAVWR